MNVEVPLCPYCRTRLTVAGRTTQYWWCGACRCAVDPLAETPRRQILIRKGILAAWTDRKLRSKRRGNGSMENAP
jgi:hypothetical protein